MNKKNILSILAIFWLAMLPACTDNNGGDALLYGNWKVYDIIYQDSPETFNTGTWFFAFQNTTVCLKRVYSNSSAEYFYGNYRLDDNTLFLDFAEQPVPPGLQKQTVMQLLRHDGNKIDFLYHPSDDSAITFRLRKW